MKIILTGQQGHSCLQPFLRIFNCQRTFRGNSYPHVAIISEIIAETQIYAIGMVLP